MIGGNKADLAGGAANVYFAQATDVSHKSLDSTQFAILLLIMKEIDLRPAVNSDIVLRQYSVPT